MNLFRKITIKPFVKPSSFGLRRLIIIFISFNIFVNAWALDEDQYQTLHISSVAATYDREHHLTVYEGNVQVEQGTSHLDGDKVTIYQSKDNSIIKMIANGKPAHYHTIPSPNKNQLFVEALQITYTPQEKIVLLEGAGQVKQEENLFTGPHIWYDMKNGIVHSITNNENERTVVIIQPPPPSPHPG